MLAVSNIAWTAAEDREVLRVLRDEGVSHLEVAPSRILADPAAPAPGEVRRLRDGFADAGLTVVAFQSLFFTRPDAALFGSPDARATFSQHLLRMVALAHELGVGRLVLGSPRNRRLARSLDADDAVRVAAEVLRPIAAEARAAGTVLCIEPNPPQYGCDFVTTSAEGAALVDAVGDAGFALHLDAAGAVLAGEDPVDAVRQQARRLRHFHVSAPDLAEISGDRVPHGRIGTALRSVDYRGAVSIEMRAGEPGTNAARVRRAIRFTRVEYGI